MTRHGKRVIRASKFLAQKLEEVAETSSNHAKSNEDKLIICQLGYTIAIIYSLPVSIEKDEINGFPGGGIDTLIKLQEAISAISNVNLNNASPIIKSTILDVRKKIVWFRWYYFSGQPTRQQAEKTKKIKQVLQKYTIPEQCGLLFDN